MGCRCAGGSFIRGGGHRKLTVHLRGLCSQSTFEHKSADPVLAMKQISRGFTATLAGVHRGVRARLPSDAEVPERTTRFRRRKRADQGARRPGFEAGN